MSRRRFSFDFASPAFAFVLMMGVVNLFSDMTYEGGGSINGQFMALLGATALAISITAGLGEFLTCGKNTRENGKASVELSWSRAPKLGDDKGRSGSAQPNQPFHSNPPSMSVGAMPCATACLPSAQRAEFQENQSCTNPTETGPYSATALMPD